MKIHINRLNQETLKDAVHLKVISWQEELNGKVKDELDEKSVYQEMLHWMLTEEVDHDKRILLGAFDHDKVIGAIFLSYADKVFGESALELNGLWVDQHYRGMYLSLRLMKEGFTYYQEDHVDKLIVYTHRFAPSRSFYLNLGGQIIKSETQLNGQLIIDIFSFDLEVLTQKLENKLKRIKTLNQTVLK
ncbi:MAG: hypothetical protein A2Y45_06070 [Tenericutes bacterium GWC2_34_14]|nr:MAG: hypothetical protein A2Z84_04155 [Tenericutes bacterium GWA2_35_7]OHE28521.1 MAG: hypothetical protein A2Y45_06070 [Tenericutes bacterium GWC2_34_14]OHE33571.1 MAG: hypothetical protein A2012_03740 [Tenericutes bacterium GWE2_34_108]OHE36856.1 MAG: hypothetical protein A2Y46_09540 [Tenericutes bacterium GWF1_35_14]OHE38064.1 MAG: hypothetical protein A2Y44_09125 [Tenericutes bacterium GWF2_35_184]OHE42087.1 MAG: hypothetical protein A3K26_07950 [Tenericutes bacterium RIFOXYA12_FULL_35_